MANASLFSAPIRDPIVEVDSQGKTDGRVKKTWIFFLNQLVDGDPGTDWTPVATNLTGTATITGKYFKNAGFIDFWIIIDSASSTSVLGTTYIDLPFDVTIATSCTATYGSTVSLGIVDPTTNRAYPPSWAAVGTPITITGRVYTK